MDIHHESKWFAYVYIGSLVINWDFRLVGYMSQTSGRMGRNPGRIGVLPGFLYRCLDLAILEGDDVTISWRTITDIDVAVQLGCPKNQISSTMTI